MQDSNPRLRLRRPEGYPDYPNPPVMMLRRPLFKDIVYHSAYLERSPSSASISLSMSSLSCLLRFPCSSCSFRYSKSTRADSLSSLELQILLSLPNFCNVLSCSLSSSHSFAMLMRFKWNLSFIQLDSNWIRNHDSLSIKSAIHFS